MCPMNRRRDRKKVNLESSLINQREIVNETSKSWLINFEKYKNSSE